MDLEIRRSKELTPEHIPNTGGRDDGRIAGSSHCSFRDTGSDARVGDVVITRRASGTTPTPKAGSTSAAGRISDDLLLVIGGGGADAAGKAPSGTRGGLLGRGGAGRDGRGAGGSAEGANSLYDGGGPTSPARASGAALTRGSRPRLSATDGICTGAAITVGPATTPEASDCRRT